MLADDPAMRARFLREGWLANQVGHPGAIRIFDDDVAEDGSIFLVMELLRGCSLRSRLLSTPERRLRADEVLAIADGVLDVLVAAHARGIIHRDLKPENVFLTEERVRVLDFGIAREQFINGRVPTLRGEVMGTMGYMPPEQARGEWDRVDNRTDLWALGATMFLALAGRGVHEEPSMERRLHAAITWPAPKLVSVAPHVPLSVALLVDRALAFDPNDRWPSACAMQAAVRSLRRGVEARLRDAVEVDARGVGHARAAGHFEPGGALAPRLRRRRALAVATLATLAVAGTLASVTAMLLHATGAAGSSEGATQSAEIDDGVRDEATVGADDKAADRAAAAPKARSQDARSR